MSALLTFTQLAAKDFLGLRPRRAEPEAHALAAEEWLKRAHDRSRDDGVSYGYSLRGGWRSSYRETSGYIATTFFALARHRADPAYRQRALRVCRWLLGVQNADGSFSNPRYGDAGIVFDTGQDLFGLARAWEETGEAAFREGALRAARWLVQIADDAGRWTRNEHLDTPHVYNTRTAWALLRTNQLEYDAGRERIAWTGRAPSSSPAASSPNARSSAARARLPTPSPTRRAACWKAASSSPTSAIFSRRGAAPTRRSRGCETTVSCRARSRPRARPPQATAASPATASSPSCGRGCSTAPAT